MNETQATAKTETGALSSSATRSSSSQFKLPRLRWWMMTLIMLGSILNYLNRQTLSVAQVQLKDSLSISTPEYSYITAVFQFTIMLQPICGYVLDVIGLRIGLAIFVVAWS